MTELSTLYAHQCIASSGLAVMDFRIAWELRGDLWNTPFSCRLSFPCTHRFENVHKLSVTFDGYGDIPVLARSRDNLAKRLEWIVGKAVLDIRLEGAEAVPKKEVHPAHREAQAKEGARFETLRKLACEPLPNHECQWQRDILAARKELGLPEAV